MTSNIETPAGDTQIERATAETMTDAAATAADAGSDTADQIQARLERGREAVERFSGVAAQRANETYERVIGRVRNTAELTEDRGMTTIANEVVGKIAGIAAREVAGVHDLGGDFSRGFAMLKERVGLGDADGGTEADRGVRVRLEGTTAAIDLILVVEFGYVVHSVTDAVRTKVISSVENMLGLEVTEVNIRVDDVHVPDENVTSAA